MYPNPPIKFHFAAWLLLPFAWGCNHRTDALAAKRVASPHRVEKPALPSAGFVKPAHVRGIYMTAWSAGSPAKKAKMIALLDKTDLNAMVIDIRDAGTIYVKTDIPLAAQAHASKKSIAIANLPALIAELKAKHVYPIARIACFRDKPVPAVRPDLAVQFPNGKPWKDRARYTWLDPYNKANWEYIGQVVDIALKAGFPEIQLDYVRFPSEGKSSTQVFPAKHSYPDPKASPTQVVAAFAEQIRKRVKAYGATLSADIFGIVSSSKSDQGIGQELEMISAPFDLISPMVYPSHFAKGEYKIKDPNLAPYAILIKSLRDYSKRLPGKTIRPWLQDFSMHGVPYGKAQVQAQIKACYELGYLDFLLWNSKNHYTEAALLDTRPLMPKKSPAAAPAVGPK